MHDQGNHDRANQVLKEVCDLYPDYWRVWVYRSLEEMNDGDFSNAHLHLELAMKLQKHPQEIAAYSHLQELEAATRPTTPAKR